MNAFEYLRPGHIDEALALLDDETRALAGGTDLLTLMQADLAAPRRLVDIKRVPELSRGIASRPDGLEIGALVTLADIEQDAEVSARYSALAQAAALAATAQLRNVATLAGNLLQEPRCWYFRNRHVDCWRRGGETCPARDGESRLHALFGGGPCYAAHPSDPAAALVALDAAVLVRGPSGERVLPLERFFAVPEVGRRSEVRLAGDELIVAVRLPAQPGTSVYLKAMDRKSWAFALAGVAARLGSVNGGAREARVVLSGVAPIPWRVRAAEQALAAGEPAERVAELALSGAEPLRHNRYKIPLAGALVRRAVDQLRAALPR